MSLNRLARRLLAVLYLAVLVIVTLDIVTRRQHWGLIDWSLVFLSILPILTGSARRLLS